ncbi:MAG TPA: hypothetical protein VIH78_00250 [Terriglobales bacterium]
MREATASLVLWHLLAEGSAALGKNVDGASEGGGAAPPVRLCSSEGVRFSRGPGKLAGDSPGGGVSTFGSDGESQGVPVPAKIEAVAVPPGRDSEQSP